MRGRNRSTTNGTGQNESVDSPIDGNMRGLDGSIANDTNGGDEPESINGFETVNPAELGTDAGNSGPRKRGRKPGQKNKAKSNNASLAGLESLLLSVHVMGATMLRVPELAIGEKEAKLLADAIQAVAEHYPLAIDPKYAAIANLVMVGVGIYGTRVFAFNARMKRERAANIDMKPAADNPNVFAFPSAATAAI